MDVNALSFEELTQLLNLFLELPDELGVGVFVDDGLAHYLLGPVGIPTEENALCSPKRGLCNIFLKMVPKECKRFKGELNFVVCVLNDLVHVIN